MKNQNLALLSVKFIAKDIVGEILYWPVWWYSRGLVAFIKKRLVSVKEFEQDVGLTVWIINWAKPMYGQYDIQGKIISFIMRTVSILYKVIIIMLYFLLQAVMSIIWLGLPIVIVWQIIKFVSG